MARGIRIRCLTLVVFTLVLGFLWNGLFVPSTTLADPVGPPGLTNNDEDDSKKTSSKKKRSKKKKKRRKKKKKVIRWGQKRNETDKKYDKRFGRVLKRIRQDKRGDYKGGMFQNKEGEEIRLWTYMGHPGCPFIIRSDISKEFTANTAMYMEMLHREFGKAYKKLLGGITWSVHEPVEIIVFADRGTYIKAGGSEGSGGQFGFAQHLSSKRGESWKARHFLMMQFTDGVTKFTKWPKAVLKHESCHMELMLRLGYTTKYGFKFGWPKIPPIWWNEGQAAIFEYWDFQKTVDENFAEIPTRGRYAPFIRRMRDTDKWRDFDYYWTMNRQKWGSEGRTFLNYCESWTIVAYMFTGGVQGRKYFQRIYDLSNRVGTNNPDINYQDRQIDFSRAWSEKFPPEKQASMAKEWEAWVDLHIPPDGRVPDEGFILRRSGFDPSITDRLEPYDTKEEQEENEQWVEEEKERRKKAKVVEW